MPELSTELTRVAPEDLVFVVDEPTIEAGGQAIGLHYRIVGSVEGAADIAFTETVTLPDVEDPAPVDDAFRRVARLLGLVAGLSYYKALVPATVRVPGGLTAGEREFLAAVIRGGLGEFAYRNDLPRALEPTIEAPQLPDDVLGPTAATGRARWSASAAARTRSSAWRRCGAPGSTYTCSRSTPTSRSSPPPTSPASRC